MGFGISEFGIGTFGEGGEVAQQHLPSHFISRLQSVLELPKNHESLRFFTAMMKAEGGTAKWNPLNTTLDMGDQWTESKDYNSTGVRNYKYGIVGVVATALTLSQRKADGTYVYGTLLKNLKNTKLTAEEIVRASASDIQHWGTSPSTMLDVLKTTK